jgi:hypothetical protein
MQGRPGPDRVRRTIASPDRAGASRPSRPVAFDDAVINPSIEPGDDEPEAGSDMVGSDSSADALPSAPDGSRPGLAARLTIRPPSWLDRALDAAIVATKAATLACAVDALVNAESPRLRGKAIRTRALGYAAGLALVPGIWRLLPDRGRYPRGLDLAVTLPLLIDAGGNALGLYEEAHLDDVVHFLNAAIVAGIAGALFGTRTHHPWQAALAGTGTAIAAETAWEVAEYLAMRAGADGMDLTYEDTMADLAESAAGAVAGGFVTWLRMPRDPGQRRRGWRHAVGGWRDAGEPIALLGGRGTPATESIERLATGAVGGAA